MVGQGVDEQAQERGFAYAGLAEEQGDESLLGEVLEAGEALGDAFVFLEPFDGGPLGEGVLGHVEVGEKHHSSSWVCWRSS